MTVKELRDILDKAIAEGYGDCEAEVVSKLCEPLDRFADKFTTDLDPDYNEYTNTFFITD